MSFAIESFYAVSAYRFTNRQDAVRYGRYRIQRTAEGEYLTPEEATGKSADFLFDEISARLAKGPASLRIALQLAADGDVVDDATIHRPADRPWIEFGTIELTGEVSNNEAEQRPIIFDSIPRVDGIDPSGDPLLEPAR